MREPSGFSRSAIASSVLKPSRDVHRPPETAIPGCPAFAAAAQPLPRYDEVTHAVALAHAMGFWIEKGRFYATIPWRARRELEIVMTRCAGRRLSAVGAPEYPRTGLRRRRLPFSPRFAPRSRACVRARARVITSEGPRAQRSRRAKAFQRRCAMCLSPADLPDEARIRAVRDSQPRSALFVYVYYSYFADCNAPAR